MQILQVFLFFLQQSSVFSVSTQNSGLTLQRSHTLISTSVSYLAGWWLATIHFFSCSFRTYLKFSPELSYITVDSSILSVLWISLIYLCPKYFPSLLPFFCLFPFRMHFLCWMCSTRGLLANTLETSCRISMETICTSLISPTALTRSQGSVTFWSVRSGAAAVEDFSLTVEYCLSVGITVRIIKLIICKDQWVMMAGMTSLSLCCSWLMLFLLVFLVKVCVQRHSYDQD